VDGLTDCIEQFQYVKVKLSKVKVRANLHRKPDIPVNLAQKSITSQ